MSDRHSDTKGQLFASSGVVVRKTVKMKQPRFSADDATESSPASDINSHLSPVNDSVCQLSVIGAVSPPAVCSTEGYCIHCVVRNDILMSKNKYQYENYMHSTESRI